MRTITDATPLQAAIAAPQLLVELTLGSVQRYATRGEYQEPLPPTVDTTIMWTADATDRPTADETAADGDEYGYKVWQGDLLDVGTSEEWETLTLRLRDESFALADTLLDADWRGSPVSVWQLVASEKVLLIDGELVSASVGAWTVLTVRRAGLVGVYTPRLRIEQPVFNFLPPVGRRLTWEGEIYILEADT